MVIEEEKLQVTPVGRPTLAESEEEKRESVMVGVTVTRYMKEAAFARAKERGMSFSAYLRELIKEDLKKA